LEYFENNYTAEELKASARADPNMDDLVQREHPQNYGGIWVHRSTENLQYPRIGAR